MLKNEEILEEFKKSLTATTKSISQNNLVEVNFTKENSSINGNLINLPEPNIESLKKNLTYIRAEADALALEFRFHSKEIHNNFIDDNDMANEIFNAVEQSRVEAKGSIAFKGIKSNITKKHFALRGVQAECLKLNGALEIAPKLDLSSRIVDLVSTGKTLKENGLIEVEKIMDITSYLIVNKNMAKTYPNRIRKIISNFRKIVNA